MAFSEDLAWRIVFMRVLLGVSYIAVAGQPAVLCVLRADGKGWEGMLPSHLPAGR
jgi:hypothetical protein